MRIRAVETYFIPVQTRTPLKFGHETLTSVTCARVKITVEDAAGRVAAGWGETPLSVQWAWPSALPYDTRHEAMKRFCEILTTAWAEFDGRGHALEIGYDFQELALGPLRERFNAEQGLSEPLPYLAALIACSAFDIALHDAFGVLHGVDVYQTYSRDWLRRDLSHCLTPADDEVSFVDRYPSDYLVKTPPRRLPVWHLVGGLDPLEPTELDDASPRDGWPVLLRDWIRRDGLRCLKVKLRGNDAAWDLQRMLAVGQLAVEEQVEWLSADFNCTVTEPEYVNEILDRLRDEAPAIYRRILYVEQPFPYDLERHRLNVRSVAARKPLFLDESAHDWRHVRLGYGLGWSGVALKTCKTQTGALLSLCWAKAHGMPLMVQDLTNPMLAQIPHVQLASHAGTIMGVESNGMQFYPAASAIEAAVHPGLYERRGGELDLSTLAGPGFGYRVDEMPRPGLQRAAQAASY